MQLVEFKNWCKDLRNKGHTLGEICRITNKPKTTVYFHIKNIPKSNKLVKKIKNIKANTIKGKGPAKGKSLLGHSYIKFNRWSPSLVNLVGHMLFDGAIRNSGILYYNRNSSLIRNFVFKMAKIYDGKPKIYYSKGVVRVAYHNVELANYFNKKSEKLIRDIKNLSVKCKREFLKAFFDDEGSVDFRLSKNSKRRIKGYQHNKKILGLVASLLNEFGISSSVSYRFNEILITKRINIEKFAKEINFSKGLRINGKRLNSVWKRSLEKRKILANLISSYQ
ncbi:MAG: hypothetical protein A3B86_00710 [Candidatus Yanofskybacteria bacterium RIFCSPHIGHO2_02_FULL_38_22b]|uniref:DOD-type homing endonuclease domain-containing protein n=1 Tax=Candidatus Yanofskybacteria bacterium RIFCSPHIGHO2_02_FULL_38_22b TaxID=1802673 RepID=A0A1F8F388_9BACT|nr:MAG: hypothetical protein A2816_03555 [Candidatus Yanofskybacteria bacterium RIFCSPHIGHO2_01_FULL_39_44]OGN07601.1 MAG: hypothetical protein A3B86_00710 [Candidatus Yanofskybacteria bacterium RIFCSPHIGHO2_02_FULL_38_22b]OGN20230.1 MAG: hypothetical protein A2910_00245 [Candidatus Yanofskybacteria bacterium RIFCSPLOWO2_01_FULL_39_28]